MYERMCLHFLSDYYNILFYNNDLLGNIDKALRNINEIILRTNRLLHKHYKILRDLSVVARALCENAHSKQT